MIVIANSLNKNDGKRDECIGMMNYKAIFKAKLAV
jgi:hypothetical protein